MAWQEVEIVQRERRADKVQYGYGAKFGARIMVPGSLAAALKWKAGDHVRVFVGAAESAGKVRLVVDPAGVLVIGKTPGATLQVYFGKAAPFVERLFYRCAVNHVVEGGALIVTLPRGALPDEPMRAMPTVAPRPPVSAQPIRAAIDATAGKTDVTHKFFNDPKPNGRPISRPPG